MKTFDVSKIHDYLFDQWFGEESRRYFFNLHDVTVNQKYADTLPYSFHLSMVESQGRKFFYLLDKESEITRNHIIAGLFGHDSIEDARLTYSNVKDEFGEDVADIIYLCTEMKGKRRKERKPVGFYKELSTNKHAVFVKLCDLIANVKFSLLSNSSMFKKYKQEYSTFKEHCYVEEYKDMFDYVEKIFLIE